MHKNTVLYIFSSLVLFSILANIFDAAPQVVEFEQDVDTILRFWKQQKHLKDSGTPRKVTVKSMEWKNCGGSNERVEKLTLSPDPLVFPGPLNISAKLDINSTLADSLQGNVTMVKYVDDIPIKIPCLGGFGSCIYVDICAMLQGVTCPPELTEIDIDCRCPFKKNTYTLTNASFDIGAAFLPPGKYEITGTLTSGNQTQACLSLKVSVD